MDRIKLIGLVFITFLLIPSAFSVVVQVADSGTENRAIGYNTNADYKHAQSFYAIEEQLDAVGVWIDDAGTPTDGVKLEIFSDSAGEPGSIIDAGATKTILRAGLNMNMENSFEFASPVSLTKGSTYWVVIERTGTPTGGSPYHVLARNNGDTYANGSWSRLDSTWTNDATSDLYISLNFTELTSTAPYFKIYSQNYTNHSRDYKLYTFNATLSLANGSVYNFSTTTGNITTNINESINGNVSISARSSRINISQEFLNYNLSFNPVVFNYSILNITAEDGITSGEISSFNVTFYGQVTQSINKSVLYYSDPANYSFKGVASGYNSRNFSHVTTLNASDLTISLYGSNSILINIYNATDSVKLSQSATLLVEGTNYTETNTTSDGDIFIQGLEPGQYDILITSNGFQSASYIVTIGENTFQTLNAYLSEDSGTSVTFSFIDKDTGAILEGVTFDVEQFVNASYLLVNSLTSDISGRVQTSYVSGERYRFTASFNGYNQKQFILDPIIFTSYSVRLEKNLSTENLIQNSEINIYFTPKVYYENTLHNFSITFSSPTGDFLYYNYTARVPSNGNTISGNGANAYGGTLEGVINVTDASFTDKVIVSYRYVKSDGTDYTQDRIFLISDTTDSLFTFLDNKGNPFGLSLFDRIIILMVTTLLSGGVAYWFGGFSGSTIVSVLVLGYFGAVGLVPMWGVWVSLVMGALIFIWGSSK